MIDRRSFLLGAAALPIVARAAAVEALVPATGSTHIAVDLGWAESYHILMVPQQMYDDLLLFGRCAARLTRQGAVRPVPLLELYLDPAT